MKKKLFVLITMTCCFVVSACSNEDGKSIASSITYNTGSTPFDMIYPNDQGSETFPIGVNDTDSSTITRNFSISRTEVTNAIAAEVLQWAYNNGTFSSDVDHHNGIDSTTVKYGGQELFDLDSEYIRINYSNGIFTIDLGYENYPIVDVSWYGAVIFCNWLTELTDAGTENLVYSEIDTNWTEDETVENPDKTGFRLPSSEEWEYMARYIDGTRWLYGDHASGDESGAVYDDGSILGGLSLSIQYGDYTWHYQNSSTSIHPVAEKKPNHLGIFDMSGNAREWCFTKYTTTTYITRGGSYSISNMFYHRVGNVGPSHEPNRSLITVGFRLAQTRE